MATPFSITTPTNAILLDKDRRGLVVFTIANQTGRSLRVRMSATPFAPTSAEWLTVEGEAEPLLQVGASVTCTVRIAVPADAAAGPQAFRLDVVSVERPDEEWAHGPAVGFEIAPPPPPKEEPRPLPGYIETVGGAAIGAVPGVVLGLLTGSPIVTVALVAIGGAIGAFAVLTIRAILRPQPWQTAAAYLVAALVLVTIGQFVAVLVTPAPSGALERPITGIVLQTQTIAVQTTPLIFQTLPPFITFVPFTPLPSPTAVPVPEPTAASAVLTVPLALLGVVLAALAARAGTRFLEFKTL